MFIIQLQIILFSLKQQSALLIHALSVSASLRQGMTTETSIELGMLC